MKSIVFKSLIFASMLAFFACSKDEEAAPQETKQAQKPAPSAASIDKAQSVKKAEKPKAEKVQGVKTVQGKQIHSASQYSSLTAEAKGKLKTLTNGSKLKADAAMECWYISKLNDKDVSGQDGNDQLYFFDEDGTYYVYDTSSDNWDWGFFYVSDDLSVIALDVKADGTAGEFWLISSLSEASIELTDGNDKVLLESIDLSGFDEEEYDAEAIKKAISGKPWYLAYEYTDGILDECNEDEAAETISAIQFNEDGTIAGAKGKINSAGDVTDKEEFAGTWSVNAAGEMLIKWTVNGQTIDMQLDINYLDGEELSVTDWDVDGKVQTSDFLTEEAFLNEIVKELP